MPDRANQQIQQKNKKTITPVEVISALREQGYENFVDRVEAEVNSMCSLTSLLLRCSPGGLLSFNYHENGSSASLANEGKWDVEHIAIAGDRRKIYRKKAADKAQNTNNNGSTLSVGSGNTNTSVDQPVDSNGNAGTSTLSVLIHQTPNAEGGEGIGLQVRDHEDEEDEADGSEEDPPPAKKARMSTSNATLGGDDETEDEGVGDEDNHEEGLADDDDDDEEEDEDDGEVESDDEEDVGDGGSDDSLEEEGEEEGEEEEIDEAVADIDSD